MRSDRLFGLFVALGLASLAACEGTVDNSADFGVGGPQGGMSDQPNAGSGGGGQGGRAGSPGAGASGGSGGAPTGAGGRGGNTGTAGNGGAGSNGSAGSNGGVAGSNGSGGSNGGGASSGAGGTTETVTFTNIWDEILSVDCTGSGCHNPGAQKGVDLSSLENAYSTLVPGQVKANSPSTSRLYTDLSSGKMPQGRSKISAAELARVAAWITAGALDN